MTFKVSSGWTGSRIFRLAMVDIPIQCLTAITVGHLYKVTAKIIGVTLGPAKPRGVCVARSLPTPTTPSVS